MSPKRRRSSRGRNGSSKEGATSDSDDDSIQQAIKNFGKNLDDSSLSPQKNLLDDTTKKRMVSRSMLLRAYKPAIADAPSSTPKNKAIPINEFISPMSNNISTQTSASTSTIKKPKLSTSPSRHKPSISRSERMLQSCLKNSAKKKSPTTSNRTSSETSSPKGKTNYLKAMPLILDQLKNYDGSYTYEVKDGDKLIKFHARNKLRKDLKVPTAVEKNKEASPKSKPRQRSMTEAGLTKEILANVDPPSEPVSSDWTSSLSALHVSPSETDNERQKPWRMNVKSPTSVMPRISTRLNFIKSNATFTGEKKSAASKTPTPDISEEFFVAPRKTLKDISINLSKTLLNGDEDVTPVASTSKLEVLHSARSYGPRNRSIKRQPLFSSNSTIEVAPNLSPATVPNEYITPQTTRLKRSVRGDASVRRKSVTFLDELNAVSAVEQEELPVEPVKEVSFVKPKTPVKKVKKAKKKVKPVVEAVDREEADVSSFRRTGRDRKPPAPRVVCEYFDVPKPQQKRVKSFKNYTKQSEESLQTGSAASSPKRPKRGKKSKVAINIKKETRSTRNSKKEAEVEVPTSEMPLVEDFHQTPSEPVTSVPKKRGRPKATKKVVEVSSTREMRSDSEASQGTSKKVPRLTRNKKLAEEKAQTSKTVTDKISHESPHRSSRTRTIDAPVEDFFEMPDELHTSMLPNNSINMEKSPARSPIRNLSPGGDFHQTPSVLDALGLRASRGKSMENAIEPSADVVAAPVDIEVINPAKKRSTRKNIETNETVPGKLPVVATASTKRVTRASKADEDSSSGANSLRRSARTARTSKNTTTTKDSLKKKPAARGKSKTSLEVAKTVQTKEIPANNNESQVIRTRLRGGDHSNNGESESNGANPILEAIAENREEIPSDAYKNFEISWLLSSGQTITFNQNRDACYKTCTLKSREVRTTKALVKIKVCCAFGKMLQVNADTNKFLLMEGQSVDVKQGSIVRMENLSETDVIIVEIF